MSSGIPDAATLVRDYWLPRLHRLRAPETEFDSWVEEEWPNYDGEIPAASYGDILASLFANAHERQREIESLCDGRFPGFGYAVLAGLVASPGGSFNAVLTTNFDDLIADALYLFTQARPLVIQHESLAAFIRPTRTRPLVVKLHGDNRLTPLNTARETEELKTDMKDQARLLLHDRGLVFLGYGGNDVGIARMLEGLPAEALPMGVYWVNDGEPSGVLRECLTERDAFWVRHSDFDELMLLIRDEFGVAHPSDDRFREVFTKYRDTYESLSKRIESMPTTASGAEALKEALHRTDESFEDWFQYYIAARRLEQTNPGRANEIFNEGIDAFPDSWELLGSYAHFLDRIRDDPDEAEKLHRRALELDPDNSDLVGNFAGLQITRHRAEGVKLATQAISLAAEPDSTILVEAWFYLYANGFKNKRREALAELKHCIELGIRSPGWSFDRNTRTALEDGHPAGDWLETLADVILENEDVSALDDWDAWSRVPSQDAE